MADTSDITALLAEGLAHHRAGALNEAAACYAAVLARAPEEPAALRLMGTVALAQGDAAGAERLLAASLRIKPNVATALNLRARALRVLGRHAEAVAADTAAIALQPDDAALYAGRADSAYALGRFAAALADYDRALALKPGFAPALRNRGNALWRLGRSAEALAAYEAAIAQEPEAADIHANRAAVLLGLGHDDAALRAAEDGLAREAGNAAAHNARGTALLRLRRVAAAIAAYEAACAAEPQSAPYANNLGLALHEAGRFTAALAAFGRAIANDPGFGDAYRNRAESLIALQDLAAAAADLEEAIARDPAVDFVRGTLLHVKMRQCDWQGLETATAEIVARLAAGAPAAAPFPLLAVYDDPALQRRAAEMWSAARDTARDPLPPLPARPRGATPGRVRIGYVSSDFREHAVAALLAGVIDAHDRARFHVSAFATGTATPGRVRIGYVSSDFREHAVAALLAGVIDAHDRARFHVSAFATGTAAPGDAMRQRLRGAFDAFHEVHGAADRDIAALMRREGIDIAVNLNGFTQGARSAVFAHRAAPVQVNFLGYPGTMGAPYMDWIVADAVVLPDSAAAHVSERVMRLPGSMMPRDDSLRPDGATPARAAEGLPAEGVVFCCFNNSHKITPAVFGCWMAILQAIPQSVLWLRRDSAVATANLRAAAAAAGVDPARLVTAARVPSMAAHLARHRLADLFLDTTPYNAHTTASDALYAGLPLVTCPGATFASRVAASLLTALGLPELIAPDLAAYTALAIDLARDPARRSVLAARLRAQVTATDVFDTAAYARKLETAFLAMLDATD